MRLPESSEPTGPRRLDGEAGFAVPTVLFMLLAALAIVTVGLMSTVRTQGGVTRDTDTKGAFAIAEAGVNEALVRYNRVPAGSTSCIVAGPGGSVVTAATMSSPAGWCAPVTAEDPVGGGTYTYSVKPGATQMEIVSSGTVDGVTRRVHVVNKVTSQGTKPFASAGVLSQDGIHLNSNATIDANTATNGAITMDSNSRLCGSASTGLGKTISMNSNAAHYGDGCTGSGTWTQAPLSLPPVDQGDVVTNNSNSRLCQFAWEAGCTVTSQKDSYTGTQSNVRWDWKRRSLTLNSNVSLTLSGTNYSFCQILVSSNSTIYVASGVRLYFDKPENCSGQSNPLTLNSNSTISPLASPANVAMLFAGSPTTTSRITLNSNTSLLEDCAGGIIVYAPQTEVQLNSNSEYCGAIAAKKMTVDSRSRIFNDDLSSEWTMGGDGVPHYEPVSFTECNTTPPASTSAPNSNC
ncbi:hypothetical protein HJD18_08710 [Thermoleophilia bacterium SCSIO 60948]|nr:hypothetical protein HJD18_08710 [Thermoleophilia bacterium SCSIO 60948]